MSSYQKWFSKNGKKLADSRRERYNNDPAYRQAALDRAAKSRKEKAKGKHSDGLTLSFKDVAKALEISTVTLRSWRAKDYYPEPERHGVRLVFSPMQLEALQNLKTVLVTHRYALQSLEAQKDLKDMISLIYANWE